ncbi:unnamed protein product [Mytilus edulis]|uniref:UMOD/GP2/OIT3-like D8C domain-containing protein n=1 Tax=Mytilus edulis TaxID=6550 RepID=A0A8S3QDC8_MYTED|nr:unnamed protein product [Mytilus edulis]
MKSFLFVYICAITSFKVSFVLSQDPCLEYQTLNEDKRSPGHKFEPSADLAISDDRLTLGWYRIMSDAGETMPTSAPDTFKCGTWYPIWLNGGPPVTTGETKTVPVCLKTFESTCEYTWDIQIKICSGGFLVYELSPSPIIDSAYCFGSSGPCPNGTSSETGYTPGCSYLEQTILRPRHWEAAYDMNMIVKCSVRARASENSVPGYYYYSADFVAGIVVCQNSAPDAFVYEVDEGQTINVTLRSTVPTGCNAQMFINNCKETIKLSYPNEYSCRHGDTKWGPIIQESCGADVLANTWFENHTLIVHGNIDNMYNINSVRYASVKLTKASSKTDPSKAWDKINIPDIIIHTLSSACHWGTCNVGIAIRSHDSLFVVRTIDECKNPIQFNGTDHDYTATITSRTYPLIDFRVCDDRNMKIQRDGKSFKVIIAYNVLHLTT